jgi:hypothetical protein
MGLLRQRPRRHRSRARRPRADAFEAFWPEYVRAHRHPATRLVHAVGTTTSLALLAAGALRRRPLLMAMGPLVDHALCQASHRLIEKNRTHPHRRPVDHARAELRMWRKTLAGTMNAEVERVIGADRRR